MKVCEEFGHQWKVVRRDVQTTDLGSFAILYFKCKVCDARFDTSDDDEMELIEKDFEGAENYDREIKV